MTLIENFDSAHYAPCAACNVTPEDCATSSPTPQVSVAGAPLPPVQCCSLCEHLAVAA